MRNMRSLEGKSGVHETVCSKVIASEEYIDYIVPYKDMDRLQEDYPLADCIQIVNETFAVLHMKRSNLLHQDPTKRELIYHNNPYYMIPNLYGDYDLRMKFPTKDRNGFEEIYSKLSLSAAEILPLHHYPLMPLTGKDVLIGIIDSGIDFTHPAFTYADGTTKIKDIWDQTYTVKDRLPQGFLYGTEYSSQDINEAMKSPNPFELIPSRDLSGHGTYLAGVAAGLNIQEQTGDYTQHFIGGAPDSELLVVKLKPAKAYIRRYYLVNTKLPVYQSTDVMMAIKYLKGKAKNLGKPLVICIGFGTNQGGHDGQSVVEDYLDNTAKELGNCVVIAGGNEAIAQKHYTGTLSEDETTKRVQVKVEKNTSGFMATVWTYDIMTVSITSPTGETISRIPLRRNFQDEVGFLLESTKIFIKYSIFEMLTGGNLISIRFEGPTEGLWTIKIFGDFIVSGRFDVWLTRGDMMASGGATFIQPDPNTTVTEPSTAGSAMTIGGYNPETESIDIHSGRGPTRNMRVKPDLVAPGIHVLGPIPRGYHNQPYLYGISNGTAPAAAIAAGASALMLQWGMGLQSDSHMNTQKIKNYFALGASKTKDSSNREWGYGKLKLMSTFTKLKQISSR